MNRPGNISRLFAFIFILAPASFANPPAPESVREIISASKLEWTKFEDESFMLRMQFILSGRLLRDRDKSFFCGIASNARDQLDRYINEQQSMLEQIEQYEDADWEREYGSTGLWRRLGAAIEETKLNQAQIDCLYSIICENSQPSDIVRQQLFKRKLKSDLGLCEALKVSMEQIEYFGPSTPNEINDIARSLSGSECKDDPEMLLTLAVLQHKYAPDRLQRTLSGSPQTAISLGKLLLADFSSRLSQLPADVNLESFSPLDAELAAVAALQEGPKLYAGVIKALAQNEKFQNQAVLYAAAILYQDSMPQKAVYLMIKASGSQLLQRDELLPIAPRQIAEQAFNLAYHTFTQDPNNCQPAIDAFDNYSRIAPEGIDEQTQYLYGNLLYNCSRTGQAVETFRRLTNQSHSLWHDAATFELLKIELNKSATPAEVNDVIGRLHDFILGLTRPEEREIQIRRQAMSLYCQILLSRDSSDAAEKVLDILNTAEPTQGLPYELYRAQAIKQLGRLEKSVRLLVQVIDFNEGSTAQFAVSLLSEILDRIELWQQTGDFSQILRDCNTIAEFAHKSVRNRQTTLLFAETLILNGNPDRAQNLLNTLAEENDVSWLRPEARLLTAEDKFEQAAKLWAEIAEMRRNDTAELNRRSWEWWRAKFYELDCLAKSPGADRQNIAHTVEVLQNTYTGIPSPWAQKLESLKTQLRETSKSSSQ